MNIDICKYYEEFKDELLDKCTECGQCITKCPINQYTDICNSDPKKIQKDIINFFKTGELSQDAYTKVYSCMECFKCIGNKHCKKGFNTMTINEIVKWEQQKNIQNNLDNNNDDYNTQKVLASIQVSKDDYKKIFTATKKEKAEYVFFAGCNVYKQPEKILNAIDIINLITQDCAFVPGINYCCGDLYNNHGKPEKATEVYNKLIEKIASYTPKKVILWCPTCSCRFAINELGTNDIPFEIITFGQFIAENIDKLKFENKLCKNVTLHEACKTSYMGIDLKSVRKILTEIPNIELIEMRHHGKDTICCGSEAREHFPKFADKIKEKRLKEAEEVNPDILIDVCQFCHDTFATDELEYDFKIENYINVISESLGINREDKYKKYKQWNNVDRVMEDVKDFIYDSPYSKEEVMRVLSNLFSII